MLKDLFDCTIRPLASVITLGYIDPLGDAGDKKSASKSNYIKSDYTPHYSNNVSEYIVTYKVHKPSLDKAVKNSYDYLVYLHDIVKTNEDSIRKADNLTKEELIELIIKTQKNWTKFHNNLTDSFKV